MLTFSMAVPRMCAATVLMLILAPGLASAQEVTKGWHTYATTGGQPLPTERDAQRVIEASFESHQQFGAFSWEVRDQTILEDKTIWLVRVGDDRWSSRCCFRRFARRAWLGATPTPMRALPSGHHSLAGKRMAVALLGVKETAPGERRVALTPETTKKLAARGAMVWFEAGAGTAAGFTDQAYLDAGALLVDDSRWADIDALLCVQSPAPARLARLKPGASVVGLLQPARDAGLAALATQPGLQLFPLQLLPRTTRAQSMDVLSSQAGMAGYKATLIAAQRAPRFFPMLTTAAGTVRPAKVLVVGAGVAGLQAIATARRLGAQVEGFDVRPETREQIQSLGARFLDLGVSAAGEGGYARALTDEERALQQQRLADHLRGVDVVICTAAVPGRTAPVILSQAMVEGMAPGSVIVDLAAESGGNCAVTVPGECIEHAGVVVDGPLNLASLGAAQASEMYARNVLNFVSLFVHDGEVRFDWEDELLAKARWVAGG